MNLTGLNVSYMLGVPSLKAWVLGVVGSCYLLHQEYDTINDNGEKVHVIKEFQRDKWFIDSYHDDQFEAWCESVDRSGFTGQSSNGDDKQGSTGLAGH